MIRVGRPLPECRLCETPTKRQTYLRTGGLCSECSECLGDTVSMPRLPRVPDDDRTTFVEGYRPPPPPVPGQLELGEW